MEGKEFGGPSPEDMGVGNSLKKEGGTDMVQQEKAKSPEELRFEELVADSQSRSLEGNYGFAEIKRDPEAVHKESLLGRYWESGDPEKMAMFQLREVQVRLNDLVWREKHQDLVERDKAALEPRLLELGLAFPQTKEETAVLRNNDVVTLENLQKLAEKIRAQQEREKELRPQLVEKLKTRNYEDPEIRQMVVEWKILQEKKVSGYGSNEGQVLAQMAQAELCLEAGLMEEVFELLESAHLQAYQEGMDLLVDEIETRIKNLSRKQLPNL